MSIISTVKCQSNRYDAFMSMSRVHDRTQVSLRASRFIEATKMATLNLRFMNVNVNSARAMR